MWLAEAEARTTEDRTLQILGPIWANLTKSDSDLVNSRVKQLLGIERTDGGWAQNPELESDAYATGTVLFTLHEAGVPATDPAYRRGVEYRLRTQLAEGSRHVKSRSPKFQPHFRSGFPHNQGQWISMAATCWATATLAFATPAPGEVTEIR